MTTTTDENVVTVHQSAADTIRDMHNQAAAIEQAWKHQPEYATKALLSLSRNLSELFSKFFGQQSHVTKDGELSLFVRTSSGFVYGLIYHGSHYRVSAPVEGDPDMSYGAKYTGRYCMATLDDQAVAVEERYCAKPYTWADGHTDDGGVPTCEGHGTFPITMPVPGDWSFHS